MGRPCEPLVSSRETECAVANSAWREAHVHCAIRAIPPARAPALIVTSNLELAEPRDERRDPSRDRRFAHFTDIAFGATGAPRSAGAAARVEISRACTQARGKRWNIPATSKRSPVFEDKYIKVGTDGR